MRPLAEMPPEAAAAIRVVFTDIDDTLTTDGRLPAAAYAALERLKAAGWPSRRSRGARRAGATWSPGSGRWTAWWARMVRSISPMTPRRAGCAASSPPTKPRAPPTARASQPLRERILSEVPGAAVAADQLYREADLAIDFCEDVAPLPTEAVDRIKALFEAEGAVAKISSIHVNGWFGAYDKLTMTRRFAAEILGVDIDAERAAVMFCGDSPNDAPMFAHFPNACGVANVRAFAGRMDAEPAFVAPSRGGEGFVEIAETLLAARAARAHEKETA
jgi:3-deoxy-D-manno-octulosonate 8-phosphate phosphatase KdsC-like HAD superfamily phosphatase